MNTYIENERNGAVLRITVLRPEVELETVVRYTVQSFLDDFRALGRKGKAPVRAWNGMDYGIGQRLLNKYGKDKALELATDFWLTSSQPLYDNPDQSAMLLFAAFVKTRGDE